MKKIDLKMSLEKDIIAFMDQCLAKEHSEDPSASARGLIPPRLLRGCCRRFNASPIASSSPVVARFRM